MSATIRIAVLGSINLDIVASCKALPRPGETVAASKITNHPGGKGANQALAAQRLGGHVSLFGCVGDDSAGIEALALLQAEGVNLHGVRCLEGQSSGIAMIAVSDEGENQIVVAPGANAKVRADDFIQSTEDYGALICQLEIPVSSIVEACTHFGGLVCLNLAPALPVPEALLKRADILVVNETEAAVYGQRLEACGGLIVTTLGAAGASISQGGKHFANAAPPKVRPIDTTGAGDTFVGALMVALLEGLDHQSALAFACAAGSAATLKEGAQPSLPTRDEVLTLMLNS